MYLLCQSWIVFLHIILFSQCLSKTSKMSPWRSNGKRQKCRFGAERVKDVLFVPYLYLTSISFPRDIHVVLIYDRLYLPLCNDPEWLCILIFGRSSVWICNKYNTWCRVCVCVCVLVFFCFFVFCCCCCIYYM